ncbi:TPA: TrbI/VirB10 family protein [Burkholderia lata]
MSTLDIKQKWLDLPPRWRNGLAIVALFGTLMIIGSFFTKPHGRPHRHDVKPAVSNLALPQPKDLTGEELNAQNRATDAQVQDLRQQITQDRAEKQQLLGKIDQLTNDANHPGVGVNADLIQQMKQMQHELDSLKSGKGTAMAGNVPDLKDPLPLPGQKGYVDPKGGANVNLPDPAASSVAADNPSSDDSSAHIRVTGGVSDAPTVAAKQAAPTPYLPPGSMFEAVLLNGMDAPTSQVGEKNPVPAVLRVKTEAILPNDYHYSVKECFVLVSGFGSMSSERAQLRTETISCIRDGGKALEAKLDGYVVGEDGRVGMRGRLISKQGQLIAKSLAAGVLSGFSSALTPQQIPQLELGSGNGYISTQRATLGSIGETGVASGFSTASKTVAAFYLDMAKEMTPVVEVDAGRKVTIVLIKGVELK